MAEDILRDAFDILRRDKAATPEEGVRLGREGEGHRGTRRGAELDEVGHLNLVPRRFTCAADHVDDVVLHLVVDVNVVDDLACLEDVLNGDDLLSLRRGTGAAHEVEDLAFFIAVRVADLYLEHEAVDLRLGQGVGALLVDRILGGQHEKRLGQLVGFLADGDLPFLHGFEQGALHLGRGAVDLVRQNEVSEHRALTRAEVAGLRVVNLGADDVGREHVGRELQPREVGVHALGERFDRERFGQAGHAFQQHVAVGKQADKQPLDEHFLADNDLAHLPQKRLHEGACAFDFLIDGCNPCVHGRRSIFIFRI